MARDYILQFQRFLQHELKLPEKECEVVKERFELQPFSKNEYFVRQGKVCRKLAFIAEGVMRYCMFREDGEDVTCYFMCENDFIGDPDSFTKQKPSVLNAQALTDCMLFVLSYENALKLQKEFSRFTEISHVVTIKTSMSLTDQRSFMIGKDAASKYKEFISKFPQVLQAAPLGYIASYLGITQQSLSRLRKQIS